MQYTMNAAWVVSDSYIASYLFPYFLCQSLLHSFTWNLVSFTQQGLKKLNDFSTKQFQRVSNHQNIQSLKQMLEKRNCAENLKYSI